MMLRPLDEMDELYGRVRHLEEKERDREIRATKKQAAIAGSGALLALVLSAVSVLKKN